MKLMKTITRKKIATMLQRAHWYALTNPQCEYRVTAYKDGSLSITEWTDSSSYRECDYYLFYTRYPEGCDNRNLEQHCFKDKIPMYVEDLVKAIRKIDFDTAVEIK